MTFHSMRQLIIPQPHHKTLEAMKSFNKNRIQARKIGKTSERSSLFDGLPQKSHTVAAAIIFAVIVLHFASQFIFFRNEDNQTANLHTENVSVAAESAARVTGDIEPAAENDAENIKIAALPKPVRNVAVKPETETAPSRAITPRPTVRKKEIRESKAERLRRAEKILTGI